MVHMSLSGYANMPGSFVKQLFSKEKKNNVDYPCDVSVLFKSANLVTLIKTKNLLIISFH